MTSRSLLASLLVLIGTRGATADEPALPNLAFEAYRLPNGLKVVLHRDATVPRVSVCVAYHVGSKDERAGRTGFAHFFEHMMFRGTKNVPNFDIPLQETGGQSNAFTSEDVTVYHETIPSEYLDRALYLEAERLAYLPTALDQEKFDTEREVVKNERRQSYENVPYGLAEEAILAHVFPKGHPYSWSVIGSMDDLNAASLKDLRQFFHEYYEPGNACLVLAGDFDPTAAKAMIARYFGPLASGKPVTHPPVTPVTPVGGRLVQYDRVSLPRVYEVWPTVPDEHPDSAPLDLLANILTDGDASRLHRALILDGRVAKDVSADSDTKEIAGFFQVRATAAEGKTLPDVEAAIGKELARLKSEPPTEAELNRALAKFEKSTYAGLTPPLSRAFTLALGYLEKDDPAYYRRDIGRYFRVTTADLARVVATYLKPEPFRLEVRPIEPGKAKSASEKAGPIVKASNEAEAPPRTPAPGPDWSKLPDAGPSVAFRPPSFERRTLSNGLEVWIAPWKTLPIVVGQLVVPVGTADDPEGKAGLADLTSTMLTQGTKDRTATELAQALESLGVTYHASADLDDTSLTFNVLSRNLDASLSLLVPMFVRPRLDPADFDRERALHLTDLLQGPDKINWIAQRATRALLYDQTHPYSRPGDGFIETVKAITLDDIRAFHDRRFAADRSKLIIVGDVDPARLVLMLEAKFADWKTKGPAPEPRPLTARPIEPGVIYLVDKPGAVQSVLRIGRVWVDRRDPTYYATAIGNHVFGVDFLSRLNKNLREKNGFSYGAQSMFLYRRTGSVWLSASSVRADATAPALREMLSELDGLAGKAPLTAEEVELGRQAVTRSFPESFEDPASIAGTLESMAVYNLPEDYLSTYLARIKAVPESEVVRDLRRLADPTSRVVIVVGDRRAIEPAIKALKMGEVKVVTPDGVPAVR